MNCAQCHFWQSRTAAHTVGDCHRFPPAVIVVNDADDELTQTRDMWPIVTAGQWCGEFKGKN